MNTKQVTIGAIGALVVLGLGIGTGWVIQPAAGSEKKSEIQANHEGVPVTQYLDSRRMIDSIDDSVPVAVRKMASGEISEVGKLPYPAGMNPPTFAQLMPLVSGASVLSDEGEALILTSPASNPDTARAMREAGVATEAEDAGVTVVVNPGDIAVFAAMHWECAWMAQFAKSADAGDQAGAQKALEQLEKFPTLSVVEKYNPEIGNGYAADTLPKIRQGDVDFAKYWLDTSCSGLLP